MANDLVEAIEQAGRLCDEGGCSVSDLADQLAKGSGGGGAFNVYPAPKSGPCQTVLLLVLPRGRDRKYYDDGIAALKSWLQCSARQRLVIMTDVWVCPRADQVNEALQNETIKVDVWMRTAPKSPRALIVDAVSPNEFAEMLP